MAGRLMGSSHGARWMITAAAPPAAFYVRTFRLKGAKMMTADAQMAISLRDITAYV
jgi:hypothetical protein